MKARTRFKSGKMAHRLADPCMKSYLPVTFFTAEEP